MKKKNLSIIMLLVLIFTVLLQTNVFATTHTLEEIVEAFKNSSDVKSFRENNQECNICIDEHNPNVLSITITDSEENELSTASFELEGSILSNDHLEANDLYSVLLLVNSVGIVNGYEDRALFDTINSEEVLNYTVENEGFEIKENGDNYSIKIDINKKIPLIEIDSSNFYLKPEDFDKIKEIIDEGECGNQNGKNSKMAYNVVVQNDENYIYMGEEDETTESTYKSILSALEVMYGDRMVEYFKSKYPDFTEGNVQYDAFSVETDVEIDTEESPIYEGTKVVLVTINNKYVKDEILRTEYIGETVDHGNKTLTLDFTKDGSYKIGFMDSVNSSDIGYLYKYILEPVCSETNFEMEDDTIYFNIVKGKIVVGDKNNSIFKIVIGEEDFEFLPTKTDVEKTTVTATHENATAVEYEVGESQDHFRYGKYNLTVNVIYGNKAEEEATKYKVLEGTFKVSNSEELTFKFNIEYSKFQKDGKVYIDDKLVDSSNYTSKEGSTIITFNKDYTKNLSAGEHTLKVAVADGEASTSFTITNNSKTTNTSSNPVTGDNIIIYIALFVISLLGVVIIGNKFRKKKN